MLKNPDQRIDSKTISEFPQPKIERLSQRTFGEHGGEDRLTENLSRRPPDARFAYRPPAANLAFQTQVNALTEIHFLKIPQPTIERPLQWTYGEHGDGPVERGVCAYFDRAQGMLAEGATVCALVLRVSIHRWGAAGRRHRRLQVTRQDPTGTPRIQLRREAARNARKFLAGCMPFVSGI